MIEDTQPERRSLALLQKAMGKPKMCWRRVLESPLADASDQRGKVIISPHGPSCQSADTARPSKGRTKVRSITKMVTASDVLDGRCEGVINACKHDGKRRHGQSSSK